MDFQKARKIFNYLWADTGTASKQVCRHGGRRGIEVPVHWNLKASRVIETFSN